MGQVNVLGVVFDVCVDECVGQEPCPSMSVRLVKCCLGERLKPMKRGCKDAAYSLVVIDLQQYPCDVVCRNLRAVKGVLW